MRDDLAILKEEYIALRAEICQSISKQHQITLAGYGLTAALVGYLLNNHSQSLEFLLLVPFVMLTMASLWTAECNRMVRAGYFIGFKLWPKLTCLAKIYNHTSWEIWIKLEKGNSAKFRKCQHHMQIIYIIITPIIISILCASIVISQRRIDILFLFTSILIMLVSWSYVTIRFLSISNLGALLPKSEEYQEKPVSPTSSLPPPLPARRPSPHPQVDKPTI
jgi:hypothetical protein